MPRSTLAPSRHKDRKVLKAIVSFPSLSFPSLLRSLRRRPNLLSLPITGTDSLWCEGLTHTDAPTIDHAFSRMPMQNSNLRPCVNQVLRLSGLYERRVSTSVPWKKIKHFERGTPTFPTLIINYDFSALGS